MRHFIIASALAGLCCQALPARTVWLTVHATLEGRSLHIEGNADLPDHTLIEWELRHERLNDRGGIPVHLLAAEGHTAVVNGRYQADVDLSRWPNGSIEVWVAFQPVSFGTPQPAHVTRLYGARGENLSGNNVKVVGAVHMRRIEMQEHVSLGATTARR